MGEIMWIFVSSMLVNNFTLILFLGICPFLGVSAKIPTGLRMGMADTFVLVMTSVTVSFLNAYVLPRAPYLGLISYIVAIAALVQIVEMVIKKVWPPLYRELGIFLPLITTNCAVLGLALLNVQEKSSFVTSLFYGFGSALGFTLVLVMFAGLRERLALARVPAAFVGAPVGFVLAGLLSLAFMGFAGLNFK